MPTKVVIFSFPATGHVNASLKFCKDLTKAGTQVCYVTLKEHFPKFMDMPGIKMIEYPKTFGDYYREKEKTSGQIKANLIALLGMLYKMTDIVTPFIINVVKKEKPDAIICDPFCIGAKIAGKLLNIPVVLFFTFLVQNPVGEKMPAGIKKAIMLHPLQLIKAINLQKNIDKKYNGLCDKPGDLLSHQGLTTVVTTSKEFHPYGDMYPDNVIFAGPNNTDVELQQKDSKLVFVSMGTVESSAEVLNACIDAAADLDIKLVITLANNKQNKIDKDKIPNNVTVYDNMSPVQFREFINKASVFINSGGINSVSDSIMCLTPMIICAKSQESYDMGVLVQKYKCGRLYQYKDMTAENIREEINIVLNDKSVSSGLEKYRQSFINSMGYKKAAELVLEKIKEKSSEQ